MSVETNSSVADELPCRPDMDHDRISLGRWCLEMGVIPELAPFAARSMDPVAVLQDVRDTIADAPPTKGTFNTRELARVADIDRPSISPNFGTLIRIAGCWEHSADSRLAGGTAERWVNPEYVHARSAEPSITDTDERIEALRHAASIGVVTLEDLSKRFGVADQKTVSKFCEYHEIPWLEWREWGKR
ncbi:hypothetical protein, partial [Aeromicrobium tamlense]|uniref:hypothetical protein n=1 Tax=Aeromicrobium tamlense TaxID=375541 RepID=UPI0031DF466D